MSQKETMSLIINDFTSVEDVFNQFNVDESKREGIEILFASYTCENYEGDAYVLCIENGKLYEVYGCHCSCYGLEENGWDTEEVTIEFLKHKFNNGTFGNTGRYGERFVNIMSKINELENENDVIELFRIYNL